MKKNIITIALFMIATPYFCFPKDPAVKSLQVSFFTVHNNQTQTTSQSEQDIDYCADVLKQLADIQKKRRLTLEEMMMSLQVMLFLFNNTNEDHSKRIEIVLNGKDKITVPYSAQIFALLNQQGSQENNQNDQA